MDEQTKVMVDAFIEDFKNLLDKHGATISAKDHFQGYAECGEDIRITIDLSQGFNFAELDFGSYIDISEDRKTLVHGGKDDY